jgi:hypothetical protein
MIDSPASWSPVPEGHPLAALHGAEVGQGVRLSVEVRAAEQPSAPTEFRATLDSDEFGLTQEPFVVGCYRAGNAAGAGTWLRVTQTAARVHVAEGEIEVPDGVDVQVISALAALVPAGGHLQMEYDSEYRRTTARALAQGVPAVATPLGGMMFSAGCGVAFTDRYASRSAREPRSLQGFRALDRAHEVKRAPQMLATLEAFMRDSADLDWDLQVKCRPVAEAAITVLRARLGVLSQDFTPASAVAAMSDLGRNATPGITTIELG